MNSKKILQLLILGLLALNILTIIYLQIKVSELTNQKTPTAMAFGRTYLCINLPPTDINNGTCNFTMPWGININCTVNATDPENNSIYYDFYFVTPYQIFNMTHNGEINVNLPRNAIGNHTLRIIASDLSGCGNNVYEEDFNVEVIHINHAPYLYKNISNNTLSRDTSFAFFLNDHFKDIDEDNLTYIVVQNDNLTLISISNNSLTTIKGIDCGVSSFYFIASDPEGLTATSNMVFYSIINCPIEHGNTEKGSQGSGGGGGYYFDCIPDWKCGKWSACQENGTRQLRCVDYNGCNPNNYIKYVTENCTYVPLEQLCQEKWECSGWSLCINNTHTRTCVEKNNCGTYKNKPAENESCIPIPSCFNGIQDGDETGVDCGGPCGACKILEQPVKTTTFNTKILIAAAITLASLIIVFLSLRKQIIDAINKIISEIRRKKQPAYITEQQKQKLLNILFDIQEDFNQNKKISLQIKNFVNLYFMELLNIEVPSKEKINTLLTNLKNKQLESILKSFYNRMIKYEKIKDDINNKYFMQKTIDELFNHLYLISEFHDKDALILPKERELNANNNKDLIYQELSNLHIALEFREVIEAKNIYKQILDYYNKLSNEEKILVYNDIITAYNIIIYLEKYY
ncbi:MAG: hypothetical protein QXK76_02890 [Candidatus Woesearchaeota archaeon]